MMHFMSCKIQKNRSRLLCLMVIFFGFLYAYQPIILCSFFGNQNHLCIPFRLIFFSLLVVVVRALVPRMNLDELFEQKGEVAKAVLEEIEKVV